MEKKEKMEKSYNILYKKLDKTDNIYKDNEVGHEIQDQIYRKFIKDIKNNKFSNIEEIKEYAKNIYEKVVKNDKDRWYS
tara:strand:- start:427 stop:663 length:237 start_codon:yes stop_codon:yes gene_type:complete